MAKDKKPVIEEIPDAEDLWPPVTPMEDVVVHGSMDEEDE